MFRSNDFNSSFSIKLKVPLAINWLNIPSCGKNEVPICIWRSISTTSRSVSKAWLLFMSSNNFTRFLSESPRVTGAVNWLKTIFLNNYLRFINEVISCPVKKYDLIINDFEPVSAWASKFKKVKCFELTNQYSMTLKNIPKPKNYSKLVLHAISYIIPSNLGYGYHYKKYTERIFFPIIRDKIRNLEITENSYR